MKGSGSCRRSLLLSRSEPLAIHAAVKCSQLRGYHRILIPPTIRGYRWLLLPNVALAWKGSERCTLLPTEPDTGGLVAPGRSTPGLTPLL